MNNKNFKVLEELDRKITMINQITQILEYDLEVNAPNKASSNRTKQLSWTSLEAHKIASSKQMQQVLEDLGASEENEEGCGETDFEKALIRNRYKEYYRAIKIPPKHIAKKRELLEAAHEKWLDARNCNDFTVFAPILEKLVKCIQEEAEYLKKPNQSLYDTLLSEYEDGISSKDLDIIFDDLERKLVPIVEKYKNKKVADDFLYQRYDVKKQEKFATDILKQMKFDFERGTLALAIHPFTTSLGEDDIRITTRYTDPNVVDPLCSTIHEGGHALYEMNASNNKLRGTSLSDGTSMGIHESQSRFWENIIIKSPEFWDVYYAKFQELFLDQLDKVDKKDFVKAINKVSPSYIRVNADEATYNLHIILRYKLEKQLIEGTLKAKDLSKEWNRMFEKLFSLTIDNESDGCLQDIHWSSGSFGYFPTYALGNLYSAQILSKIEKDFNNKSIGEIIKTEGLSKISLWLKDNVHCHGSLYSPKDLIMKITNSPLDGNYFTEYLENKLATVFN